MIDRRLVVGPLPESAIEPVELVVVTGADAQSFLQGQLAQDLGEGLPDEGAWSFLLEPDGQFGYLVRVCRWGDDGFAVLGTNDSAPGILERLGRFKIRVQATLSMNRLLVGVGAPPTGLSVTPLVSISESSSQWLCEEGATPTVEPGFFDQWGLVNARVTSADVMAGTNPFELGTEFVGRAVSFTKGCYTGQEFVARIDARAGSAPFRLCHLEGANAMEIGPVLMDGDEVGAIIRAGYSDSLAAGYATARIKRKVDVSAEFSALVGGNLVNGQLL